MVSTIIVSMIVSALSAAVSVLMLYDLQPPTGNGTTGSSCITTSWIYRRLFKMASSIHNHSLDQNSSNTCSKINNIRQPQLHREQEKRSTQCIDLWQKRSPSTRIIMTYIYYVSCALMLLQFTIGMQPAHASLYVNNITYPTLPALFGRYMVDGKTYEARLQYFHDNPYLCDIDEKTLQKFVPPTGGLQISHFGGSNLTIYEESVALLVVRGNCPFQKKASIAELIHDSIKVLLIANFNLDNIPEEDETLVPMYSQYGDTRLVLLSISHATGQALKKYLAEMPSDVTKLGGPIVQFDSIPPYGLLTEGDLESMMFSALGIFFMLISFTGCLVILTGTYHQLLMNQNGGNPITAATQRRLLTEAEVQQFTSSLTHRTNASNNNEEEEVMPSRSSSLPTLMSQNSGTNSLIENDEILDDVEADQCAVCLGEFDIDEDETIAILPCQHKFHTTCISPWLTERQSKCPLCKFDVLQHIRDQSLVTPTSDTTPEPEEPEASVPTTTTVSFWDQLRRYRWTSIATYNHDDNNVSPQLDLRDGVMRMVEVLSIHDSIVDEEDDLDDMNHRPTVRSTGASEMTDSTA